MRRDIEVVAIWIALLLPCASSLYCQSQSYEEAVQILKRSNPYFSPDVELGATDPQEKLQAERLIAEQMKALTQLEGCNDSAIVTILIPYLNYTTHVLSSSRLRIQTSSTLKSLPDVDLLSKNWPAFAVIKNNVNAIRDLSDYISNSKNEFGHRIAAFSILRYLDDRSFEMVAKKLDQELATAGPLTRQYVHAIEIGESGFDGLHALDRSQ